MREDIEKRRVKVFKVDTLENPTDMLTKSLPKEKFELCLSWLECAGGNDRSTSSIQGGGL